MKDRHHKKSSEHSKRSTEKSRSDNHTDSRYPNVLKERHIRDDKAQRRDREYEKSSKSSGKSHREHNKCDQSQEKSSKVSSHEDSSKRRKHNVPTEESYEELSRKKRKIESELRALELEEAEETEADQHKSHKSSAQSRRNDIVRVKEEPTSDNEHKTSNKAKQARKHTGDSSKHKPHSSKPSDSEGTWGKLQDDKKEPGKPKEKPNFATSGKLAEDTNTYNGVVIKYNEPVEARKPKRRWRLYPFKGDTDLPFIPIHRQSAYLFGRTRAIADIPIDHPSCSKQHAVLQFRLVPYKKEDGSNGRRVRPYIIDLESSNGTFVNNKKIDSRCYVELIEKDIIKFGFSSREYVILHEESKGNEEDDDVVDSS